jgi:hypothetical protein
MRSFACGIVLAIAAMAGCAGDSPKDAACHGALYDPCHTEHDCANMDCLPFQAAGFTACTQSCTVGDNTTCPRTASGMTATCNANAVCEPPATNTCMLP